MSNDDLQIGGNVKHQSGTGPVMTIDSLSEANGIKGAYCSWFGPRNKPEKQWFPLTSLKKLEESKPSPKLSSDAAFFGR